MEIYCLNFRTSIVAQTIDEFRFYYHLYIMIKPVKILLYNLSLLILMTNCRDKTIDEYYARPETLADPIYQQLEAKGNFKSFLELVDKAGYKQTLSGAGYWTVFAPNDRAFEQYFAESGVPNIGAIDSATARGMVSYALVYNAFTTETLVDYQSNIGWVENEAFRRRTAYYTGVYTEDEITVGEEVLSQQKVVASNRNGGYLFGDNNNKYIPYFMQQYFEAKQLSAADYNYFYPSTDYTGFNVAGASVVNKNVLAENGIIHEVDRVTPPSLNIEQYMASKPEYSGFRELFDKYMVSFQTHPEVTERYQVLTGTADPVYVKFYDFELPFSPNNENFEKLTDNDGQSNSWSIFAPTNEVLNQYIQTVLLEHYESLDKMPLNIIRDFLTAHMWGTAVWPTKFASTSNSFGEEARFDAASNVVDAQVLSNGFFYGTNKVQEANVFHTVYGKAYLDPDYSMMIRALEGDLKLTVSNPAVKFTMFLISNEALTNAGFSWDTQYLRWVYTPPEGGGELVGGQASIRLQRIINLHIAFTFSDELKDLSGEGIVETFGGEYISYNNGQVIAAGNADLGEVVAVSDPEETSNGTVYYTDRILNFSDKKISEHIAEHSQFSSFYQYLVNSSLMYDPSTLAIEGVETGTPYTLFIPTNEAINQAVNDGVLPGTLVDPANPDAGMVPNFTPSSTEGQNQVASFIRYHILANDNIVADGKKDGSYETIYQNIEGETGQLSLATLAPGALQVTDSHYRTANIVSESSNVLSNRAILHQIDNYLLYKEN